MSKTWLVAIAVQYLGIGMLIWRGGQRGLGAMLFCYACANIALLWDIK